MASISIRKGQKTNSLRERGIRLSGGERQRLARARAFLKDAPILLLEETPRALARTAEQSGAASRRFAFVMMVQTAQFPNLNHFTVGGGCTLRDRGRLCQATDEFSRCGNGFKPGVTILPMNASTLLTPEDRARFAALAPLGRLGNPNDLAGIALFLASGDSAYCTGAVFTVDGGPHCHCLAVLLSQKKVKS